MLRVNRKQSPEANGQITLLIYAYFFLQVLSPIAFVGFMFRRRHREKLVSYDPRGLVSRTVVGLPVVV